MPYIATVNEQAYRVDAGDTSEQREIIIDGNTHKIDWRFIAPLAAEARSQLNTGGRYSLIIGGRSYEIFARRIIQPELSAHFAPIAPRHACDQRYVFNACERLERLCRIGVEG